MYFFLYSVVISTLKQCRSTWFSMLRWRWNLFGFENHNDFELKHCIKVEVRQHFNVEINLVGFENYNDVELTTSYQRWSLTLTNTIQCFIVYCENSIFAVHFFHNICSNKLIHIIITFLLKSFVITFSTLLSLFLGHI